MPRQPRHEQALEILVRKKEQTLARDAQFQNMNGFDVEGPIQHLALMMDIGNVAVLNHLHRLERAEAISLVYSAGREIVGVRIKKTSLEETYHEFEVKERVIAGLNNHKRTSKRVPGRYIVHPLDFSRILVEADLGEVRFYATLKLLEEEGLIRRVYQTNHKRILFIELTDQFVATFEEIVVG